MLVLSRKVGEKLVIGDNITVVVSRVSGNRVTLAIEAPQEVRIVRGELKAIEVPPKEPAAQANRPENFESLADTKSFSLLRLAK